MESIAILLFSTIFLPFIVLILFLKWNNPNGIPWNWPIVGMIPTVVLHMNRIHDRVAEILHQAGSTFFFNGVWFAENDFFLTANPSNIHHILSANFQQYPKGPDFKYIFDTFGDGIFNSNFDSWKSQRLIAYALVHNPNFLQFLEKILVKKVKQGLIPLLENVCENGSVLDLQDLLQRFSFDSTCMFVTGFDLQSLSLEFPKVPFTKAMDDVKDVMFLRHFFPKIIWEFQKKLQIGQPKKLQQAWNVMDETISKLIASKKERLKNQVKEEGDGHDLLTSYITISNTSYNLKDGSIFLKDTVLNLMMAGRDSLSSVVSWFFFCLSNNPIVETKIIEELEKTIPSNTVDHNHNHPWRIFSYEELKNLVYLHGALCETLMLYPTVPFQHKVPSKPDVLPSGHHVNPKTKIVVSLYALGRMSDVWGKDCMEFKPERWISNKGKIKRVPSYNFLAFNAGPRTCLEKEVAFIEMKIFAAAIIYNFNITRQIEHEVVPSASTILYMKNGFKVKVTKRSS